MELQEKWTSLKDMDSTKKLILLAKEFTSFKYCNKCHKIACSIDKKLHHQKGHCYYCGRTYFITKVYYNGIIKTIEEANEKLTFNYDNVSTNMGEYSWGKHIYPWTDGLQLGRIGVHDDKTGNHYTVNMERKLKLPFLKGDAIIYEIWWYECNENEEKPKELHIYDLDINEVLPK